MGTFIIRPTGVASGGTPTYDANGGYPNDAAGWFIVDYPTVTLLDAIQATTTEPNEFQFDVFSDASPNSYDNTLRLLFSGSCIYLDGSLTPIAFAGLPSGFTALSASVKIDSPSQSGPSSGSNDYYMQWQTGVNGTVNTPSYDISFSGTPPTMLDILSEGMGIRCNIVVSDPSDVGSIGGFPNGLCNFRIEGTYSAVSYTFDLEIPDEPVDTGSPITVTSDPTDPLAIDFEQVTGISIDYTDDNGDPQSISVTSITKQDTNELIFLIPDLTSIGTPPGVIIINITSSQFSGSVTLGKLITIYFINAPGIYRLVADKTSDTLYDVENGGTVDVKIPDPFWETGFIGD